MRICALGDLLLDVIVRLSEPLSPGADARAATRVGAGGQAANVAAWAVELGSHAPVREHRPPALPVEERDDDAAASADDGPAHLDAVALDLPRDELAGRGIRSGIVSFGAQLFVSLASKTQTPRPSGFGAEPRAARASFGSARGTTVVVRLRSRSHAPR